MPNIAANTEIKISAKYVKSPRKGRSLKESTLNIAMERSTEEKEKRQREKNTR